MKYFPFSANADMWFCNKFINRRILVLLELYWGIIHRKISVTLRPLNLTLFFLGTVQNN
jgi:hypothetical protein